MAADYTSSTPSSPATPKSHRKKLPAPWTQVVRGEPEPTTTPSPAKDTASAKQSLNSLAPSEVAVPAGVCEESSDSSNDNAALSKKSAWKTVNGVVGPGHVMGGAAWPTITESTRASSKLSSNSSKPLSDGSISVTQEQVISHAPQKQATANGHPNFNHNHKQPHRQRSTKKGGSGGVAPGQSSFSRPPGPPPLPPPPPPFPIPFGNLLPPGMELPIRDPSPYWGNNRETRSTGSGVGSHSHDHSSQRHPSRRGNFGSRPRGDGGYNNGYGVRRDQDREWNASRNSSGRDVHMHQMVPPPPPPPPRGLTRPALPGPIPYIPPRHVRPFGNSMTFDMVPPPFLYVTPMSPDSYRGVPLVLPPPPHIYFPVIDPNVPTLLLNQIDYYFSEANLVKDDFLRSNMDNQGWVSVSLIASFPRVSKLTSDVQLILDTLGASTVVEVQGDKIRKRENWSKWIPSVGQTSPNLGLQSRSESTDVILATSIQEVQLDEVISNTVSGTDKKIEHSEEVDSGRVLSSEETISQLDLDKGQSSAEASNQDCT